MLSDIRCEECGQALSEEDLNCWACGALTESGRRHKRGEEAEDEEEWSRSVEEAKQRRDAEPQVDPDEALRQALAEQGAVDELARATQADEPGQYPDRSEYPDLRGMTSSLNYLAMGAAAIFAVMAIIILAYSLSTVGEGSILAPLIGFGAAVVTGVAAMLVYYLLRLMAEMVEVMADTADNSRRSLVVLRMLHKQMQQTAGENKEEQAEATGDSGPEVEG